MISTCQEVSTQPAASSTERGLGRAWPSRCFRWCMICCTLEPSTWIRGTQPRLCIEQKLLGRSRRDQALSLTLFEGLDPNSGKKAVSTLLLLLFIWPSVFAGRKQSSSHLGSGVGLARGISPRFGETCLEQPFHGKALLHLHCNQVGSQQEENKRPLGIPVSSQLGAGKSPRFTFAFGREIPPNIPLQPLCGIFPVCISVTDGVLAPLPAVPERSLQSCAAVHTSAAPGDLLRPWLRPGKS